MTTVVDLGEEQISFLGKKEGGSKVGNLLRSVTKKKEGGTAVGNALRSKVGTVAGAVPEVPILNQDGSASGGDTKKGMPTWGWVAIGVGAVAVIGTGIYLATKK
jgi:hypothetical protein